MSTKSETATSVMLIPLVTQLLGMFAGAMLPWFVALLAGQRCRSVSSPGI
jgi:hypothetical protein